MSDKPFDKLNVLDQTIRRASRCGMTDGTVMVIEFVSGFEKFNTRPYHNYESWGQGYRVHGRGVWAEREDLDDAIREWAACADALAEGREVPQGHLLADASILRARDGEPYRARPVLVVGKEEEGAA